MALHGERPPNGLNWPSRLFPEPLQSDQILCKIPSFQMQKYNLGQRLDQVSKNQQKRTHLLRDKSLISL